MDILVTVPKKEAVNTVAEDAFVASNPDSVQFWSIGRKPKKLNVGDRVYFVENGFITCYHVFLGFIQDPVCQVTGRVWRGLNLLLKCPAINLPIKLPCKGFRGFRYKDETYVP